VTVTRLRRTFMMTPLLDDYKVNKAAGSAVDVVVLDLEDGIHPDRKVEARQRVVELLRTIDWQGKDVVVRVNSMASPTAADDIAAVAPALPTAIFLPKVDHPSEVTTAAAQLDDLVGDGVELWGLIESAKGLVNVEQIAVSSPRLTALVLGPGDLSADLGLNVRRYTVTGENGLREEILYAQSRLVAACRAAGISPMTGTPTVTRDPEGAEFEARYLFRLGFDTVAAFTPAMVEAVHRAYIPTPEDSTWAATVLDLEEAKARDAATFGVVDGAMVDGPFFRGARQIAQRLEQISDGQTRVQ
jgi:citrate lyase beta subunit